MKRKFTFLIAAAFMLLTMMASTGEMWGQTRDGSTTTYTFSSKSWAATPANWTSGKDGNQFSNGRGVQVTTGASGANATSPTSFANVSQVVVTYSTNASNGAGSISIQIGSNTAVSKNVTSTGGTTDRTLTYDFSPNQTGSVKLTVTCTTNSVYVKSVAITTNSGPTTYTVTYHANGATSGEVPTDANSYNSGATVTVLGNTGSLAKTGHSFNNWNTLANGTGTPYSAGNTFAISSNTTLFAQWTANTHNVTMPTADTYGSYTASATENVPYNETVTLTYTPASGYEAYSATWSVNGTPLAGNTFPMPDLDATVTVSVAKPVVYEWVAVALSDLTASDIFVIVGNNGSSYAMSNDKGTGDAPDAIAVTIANGKITTDIVDKIKWNIGGNANDGYTFYPNGSTTTWLYCTNANNGVRVGTNNDKTFVIDKDYLKHVGTSRYIGVYNSQDWRCYTSNDGNIANQTFAFYKRVVKAEVDTPVLSIEGGTYNTNLNVTITCATNGATIYYTTDGTTPTNTSTEYTGAVSITQTTTLKAIAIKGDDESNIASATYTLKCATPTFSPAGGAFTSIQNVTISSTSPAVSIYYTIDGTTPTNESTLYDGPISISETKTLKAVAMKSNWTDSEIATANYTIDLPLATMDEIYAKAVAVGSTATNVNITFNNWVISGVNGSSAYLTDGTKGCIIYQSNHGFVVGNILSGTAQCQVVLYNNAPELKGLKNNTSGLTVTTGGTVNPTTTTIAELSAINTGSVFTIRDLEYDKTDNVLSDGVNEIKIKDGLYDFSDDVKNGDKYHVIGVFVLYNLEKQIYPRSEADIMLAADMSATDFSGLTTFTYIVEHGPSAAQKIDILGENFAGNLTVTASGDYEVSTDNTTYSTSVVIEHAEGIIAEDLYIRLKAGLATGEHNGTLTFEATNLTTYEQALAGTVSATQSYNIMINAPIANGSVVADVSVAEAGETITLTATPDECYQFVEWVTEPDNLTWTSANQFTMPAEDVLISATFSQIKYTVHYSINGNVEDDLEESVNCGEEASLWDNDEVEILGVTLPSGFSLLGWSSTEGSTETVASFEPDADATLYAVLIPAGSVIGYELITSVSQITAGKYLIAAFKSTTLPNPVEYYIANGTISSGDMNVTESKFSPTNNVFAEIPTGGVEFEFTGNNTDGFIISCGSKSLGYTTYESRKLAMGNYNAYLWKFSNFTGGLSTGALYMTCNYNNKSYTVSENATSGNGVIRGYASSTKYRGFYLFRKAEITPISNVTEVTTEQTISTDIPASTCVIVENGAVLTFNGENQGTVANLVIEDGGQLVLPENATVQATVKKAVGHGAKSTGDWYTISSPVNNIAPGDVTNLIQATATNYDFYYYNEPSGEWFNHKAAGHAVSNMTNGRGYLYWNADGDELAFAGELNTGNVNVAVTADGSGDLKGINLIGNPYSHNIYKGAGTAIPNTGGALATGFYMLSNSDSWVACTDNTTAIKPAQGILVKATEVGTVTMTNTTAAGTSKAGNDNIRFTVANNQYEDVAYAMFNNEMGLNKINHRNPEVPMLYIPQDGTNYAIATMSDDVEMFTLSFKTVTTGKYTLGVKLDGKYDYLHIVDRLTGEDIDMLAEGEYSFMGTPKDLVDRFIVKLSYNATVNDVNDAFAYQSGNEIIVNGEGELQIFDLMGRKVMTQVVNGVQTVNVPAQGVYIFRLNGKVQKIVVR